MTLKKAKAQLEKAENLLSEAGYVLRLEKGTFHSGYCILEHRKVVVVNKFLNAEGRLNVISELLSKLKIDENRITPQSKEFYRKTLKEQDHFSILQQLEEQKINLKESEK